MTPEELERYKEAEKAHLRKLKELKKAVHTLERQKSISTAAGKIAEGHELLEKQKDLVDDLAMDTARHEARLDIALESAADADEQERTEALEEELQRERAQALVKQLKRQMGGGDEDRGSRTEDRSAREENDSGSGGSAASDAASRADTLDRAASGNPTGGRDNRPEKTIGRM